MSYGKNKTVVDLQRMGTTLIVGEDLDNTTNGQSSNGVGKSTIMNALTYAVYDRPISDIKIDDIINNVNGKHLEVIVEFDKSGIEYRIERRRKSGKSGRENSVNLFINGEDKTRDSTKHTDHAIQEIIGMSYDMFVRIVVISADHTPFLNMPVNSHYQANQTEFIERLFNLTVLSEQAVLLKDMIKSTEDSMTAQKLRIEYLEKEHARYSDQLAAAKTRITTWHTQNQQTIATYTKQLDEAASIDVDAENKLHTRIVEIGREIKDIKAEKKQLKQLVTRYEKIISDSQHELEHLSDQRCPYCLQQYADANTKLSQCHVTIADANHKRDEFVKEMTLLHDDELRLIEDEKLFLKQRRVDDVSTLLEIHTHRQTILQKVQDLQTATNPFFESLDDLESTPIERIDYSDINELKRMQDHQQFLLKLLTKKDSFVRKALLNKNLPFLNARLHHYLSQLGMAHKVEFTHEMTASISLFGRPLSFGNLSNGQKARVNISLSLAFRDVLQKLHTPVNICLLDEVLDVGLDTVGVQAAARMLKQKARDEKLNIFIISHRDEIGNTFDRTMVVQMQKGFSSIKDVDMV